MAKQINNQAKFDYKQGVLGVDAIPANAAVLTYTTTAYVTNSDGKRERGSVEVFLAVTGVKSTSAEDVVMPILALSLSAAREKEGKAAPFAIAKIGANEIKTNIKFTKVPIDTFLNKCDRIRKSDSKGELTRSVTLDEGLKLSNTALKVKKSQPIFEAKGNELRVLMHTHAKAVIAQANMMSDIVSTARTIFAEAYAKEHTQE